jgi:predicted N-formylglutamate amidohydrolase
MASLPLIAETDPPAVEFCHELGHAPVLLTCDHASRRVPKALDNLGLADALIARHIGWDIGAAEVTRRLAPLLDAPGNANLSGSARRARRDAIFDPYHGAIAAWIAARRARSIAPAVISIHSFTPVMKGVQRPWHVGVLWDGQGRIALPLLAALRAEPGLVVGDNEPYSAREPVGYTQRHHAFDAGLPHVAIELRQDLVADPHGAAPWAERLARALKPILARTELYVAIAPPPPHS